MFGRKSGISGWIERADWNDFPTCTNGVANKEAKIEYLPNGMRVLDRQTFASPIHMLPGDTLECTYRQTAPWGEERETKLATHTCTKPMSIDTAIIVELDDGSLRALGLKSGYAGIFGESV